MRRKGNHRGVACPVAKAEAEWEKWENMEATDQRGSRSSREIDDIYGG